MSFLGSIAGPLRRVLAAYADEITVPVLLPCAGNFTVGAALRSGGYMGRITGCDITLYTSALGAYLAGERLPVVEREDCPEHLRGLLDCSDPARLAASVAIMLDLRQVWKAQNVWHRRVLANWRRNWPMLMEKSNGGSRGSSRTGMKPRDPVRTRACGDSMPNDVEELLARSASTDIQVLLTAKESAKRAALDEPSQANLAALDRASKMLESAMEATKNLKNWQAVLDHVADNGRKLSKTKLYSDINRGLLRRQPDGTFRLRDVQRYMASLPMAGTPDALVRKAADRQRRKEEADIRKAEAAAEREEFDLQVKKGRYIRRDQVYAELAARAVTLSSGLKTAFEARNLDLVALVDGNPKKAVTLVEALERICDDALNEYSREMEFEVVLEDLEQAAEEVTDEQE